MKSNSSIHRRVFSGSAAFSLFLAVAALPAPARADLAGFGLLGAGTTQNQGQTVGGLSINATGNTATLTNGAAGEGNSLFSNTQQTITAFNVSFTYTDVGATGSAGSTADGVTFTIQNDSRGTLAVGGTGSSLGYAAAGGATTHAAIASSVAVGFDVYNQSGTFLGTNGTFGTSNTSKAVLNSGDPINVSLSYANGSLTEILTDANHTANTSTFTYPVNIANIVGANTAYVGFTGGDGNAVSNQTISNFTFSAVPEPATWVDGCGVCGLLGLALRRRFAAAFLA